MCERCELLAVQLVGLGLDIAVITSGAEAGVDRDGADGQIPADAHPAVASRGVVRESERRRQAMPARRQVERIAESCAAARARRRRLDEPDASPRVSCLDAAQRVGVELMELGVLRCDDDRVDHRREVIARAVDDALLVVDSRAGQAPPVLRLGIEIVGLDVVGDVSRRQERRIKGHEDVDRPLELLAVGQELEAVRVGRRDVDEPGVERRDVRRREVLYRHVELAGDRPVGDVDAHIGTDPDRRRIGLRLNRRSTRLPRCAVASGFLRIRESAAWLRREGASLVEHEGPGRLRAVDEVCGHRHRPRLIGIARAREQRSKHAAGRTHIGGLDADRHSAAERARGARPAIDPGDLTEMLGPRGERDHRPVDARAGTRADHCGTRKRGRGSADRPDRQRRACELVDVTG